MCGIAGIYSFSTPIDSNLPLMKMANAISHRGPDAQGLYINSSIALAHRRLSIIDLSIAANQPFFTDDHQQVCVFNGEIFNFNQLKQQFKQFHYKTSSDTEVVAELFAKEGIKAVSKMKGMFAFAQWDNSLNTLWLVRDRLGVKPLYYYQDEEHLIFASELRSILASGLVQPKINKKAVYQYLRFQSAQEPDSLIENIRQIPPGHSMKVSAQGVEIQPYWSILESCSDYDYSSKEIVVREVRQRLEHSVASRLVSDVPIGAFLSGGIDSSAVVALMAQHSLSAVNTFNISFTEKDFDESLHAEQVARKFNTLHHRIVLPPTVMLDEMEEALKAMDTPSGDGINTYVVSKAVKMEGLTVALSGVGGDELFAGYPFFGQYLTFKRLQPYWKITSPLRKIAANYLQKKHPYHYNASSQVLQCKRVDIDCFYPVVRGILSADQLSLFTHLFKAVNEADFNYELPKGIRKFPSLSQVSIADLLGYTRNTLLKDTDQMSMAVALEVREPFFDHELIEYVLGVPNRFKMGESPKSLLVAALGNLLPPEIVYRKKQGFTFPWALWMKNELKGFCEQHLVEFGKRDFVNREALQLYWKQFLKGDPSIRWMELWQLVVLEDWMKRNHIE